MEEEKEEEEVGVWPPLVFVLAAFRPQLKEQNGDVEHGERATLNPQNKKRGAKQQNMNL